jgi:Uma2 family endonuclease
VGEREYWIIDRFRRTMTVHRYAQKKVISKVISARQVYRTPLLPGFRLSLSRLLKLADRWKSF